MQKMWGDKEVGFAMTDKTKQALEAAEYALKKVILFKHPSSSQKEVVTKTLVLVQDALTTSQTASMNQHADLGDDRARDALAAENASLRDTIREMRGALWFYANPASYQYTYSETGCECCGPVPTDSPPMDFDNEGDRAREAIALADKAIGGGDE